MNQVYDLINSWIPAELSRLFFFCLLLYIAYKVTATKDALDRAILSAERDRKQVAAYTTETLDRLLETKELR